MRTRNLMQPISDTSFEMNATKQMALQRVRTLFRLAREVIHEDSELAQRYVKIANRIMHTYHKYVRKQRAHKDKGDEISEQHQIPH